jgi:ABC-2 type transport system permease protein
MKALSIQIQREFWEHRGLWMAPLLIAVVMLLAAAIFGHVNVSFDNAASHYDGPNPPPVAQFMALGWAVPFFLAAAIQGSTYLIDCLYAERRDRSILFWRSMPVTDARTVLVKLLVGLVLVPLGNYALAAASGLAGCAIMALRNHDVAVNGLSVVALWNLADWLQTQVIMLYGLVAAMLWYAPFAAYLILISVWARRSPYAWAFLPPLLLELFEYMVFGTHYVSHIVNGGFGEFLHLAYGFQSGDAAGDSARYTLQLLTPSHLLASQRLCWGLAAAVGMVVLAIRLRRYRDDS